MYLLVLTILLRGALHSLWIGGLGHGAFLHLRNEVHHPFLWVTLEISMQFASYGPREGR